MSPGGGAWFKNDEFSMNTWNIPDINTFDVFRQYDGYKRFEKAVNEYQPDDIPKMVMECRVERQRRCGIFDR